MAQLLVGLLFVGVILLFPAGGVILLSLLAVFIVGFLFTVLAGIVLGLLKSKWRKS